MKNSLSEDKMKEVISEEDKTAATDAVTSVLQWLDTEGSTADKEAFEAKDKELNDIFHPIMSKAYKSTGGEEGGMPGGFPGGFPGGMPGGFPGGMSGGFPGGMPGCDMPDDSGPSVEEVD